MPAPLDDIRFVLEAVTPAEETGQWDRESQLAVLASLAEFADGALEPVNADGDSIGCSLKDGRVHMPPLLVQAYQRYAELGWHLISLPEAHGGIGAPPSVGLASAEILAGANHAFQMIVSLIAGASEAIEFQGSEEQQTRLMAELVSGECLATMCLTEAGAGSDLSAVSVTAVQEGNGGWKITGDKILISGGDQDMTPRIMHLVLARTGSKEDGIRGLSLFVCPSHRADNSRNAVEVLRIEEKLGLHASPTCQLSFAGADAEILGTPGDGLKIMFKMMNRARLETGLQSVALGQQACTKATEYAQERRQGGRAIAQHADVRRMLMDMESRVLGSRAMAYRTGAVLDNQDLAEFLTPICKVFCTETGNAAADTAIQVLGGYGYLPEYGVEQFWRDSRITRIYEGTNGVLSMTLARRLLTLRDGAPVSAFLAEIEDAANMASGQYPSALRELAGTWQKLAGDMRNARDSGHAAFPFMMLTGNLLYLGCWARLEASADSAPDPARIRRLARFALATSLPATGALACQVTNLLNEDWAGESQA